MITAIFASWESITDRPADALCVLARARRPGLLGLFASLDVVLFYIFFEFTLIPLFFLIGIWGGPERRTGVDHVLPVHAGGKPADAAGRDRLGGRPLSAQPRHI